MQSISTLQSTIMLACTQARAGVWLDDPRDFSSFNKVFGEYFKPEHAPARACVQANMMVDCKVEIDCVAYKKKV